MTSKSIKTPKDYQVLQAELDAILQWFTGPDVNIVEAEQKYTEAVSIAKLFGSTWTKRRQKSPNFLKNSNDYFSSVRADYFFELCLGGVCGGALSADLKKTTTCGA